MEELESKIKTIFQTHKKALQPLADEIQNETLMDIFLTFAKEHGKHRFNIVKQLKWHKSVATQAAYSNRSETIR